MSIAGLLFSMLLAIIAVAIVARPLMLSRGGAQGDARLQQQREQLRTAYERVLTNIRDLDEDCATGKISEEDRRPEREFWARRGVQLLRDLDEIDRTSNALDADRVDRAIEAAVAARRGDDTTAGERG